MINRIASNDLNLEFSWKDIDDVFASYEGKTGKHFDGNEREEAVEKITIELKQRGYNIK